MFDFLFEMVYDVPMGVRLLIAIPFIKNISLDWRTHLHKFNVLLLTFLAYACYHMARKPTSVVKNVLHQNCSTLEPPVGVNSSELDDNWCNWSPFDGDDSGTLLGALDSAFLFAYAFGMYFTGSIGERMNVRYFLTIGMLLSATFSFLFGLAYWTNIHSLTYFIIIQILAGLSQSTGWPGCVAAVGNWFGKTRRGLIMGIWRAHHSVGNIMGTLIAGAFVDQDWGLSFAVPAAILAGIGILTFFFLVPDPRAVGCPTPVHIQPDSVGDLALTDSSSSINDASDKVEKSDKREEGSVSTDKSPVDDKPVNFFRAVRIPGVLEYSFSLFFTKLINYTFLYWLPNYLKYAAPDLSNQQAADLSTLYDIGGIFGGIMAGLLSDQTGMSALTCGGYFILTIPMLFVYRAYGGVSDALNMFLLFVVGLLANGPYALITTAVSADLGTHPVLKGSTRALATVTAIIDGTGSIGAAVGPLLAGALSSLGWDYVFYALMVASGLGLLVLSRIMVKEVRIALKKKKIDKKPETMNEGISTVSQKEI